MSRPPKPYTTYQRADGTWYYSINWTAGVPDALCEQRKSSGIRTAKRKTDPPELTAFIQSRIRELQLQKPETAVTLGEYGAPFYTDRCPHRARVGRHRISDETLYNRRRIIERHIATDPLWDTELAQIRPADVGAFRERMFAKGLGKGTVKRIMDLLRTVLAEAALNGVIDRDPARLVPRLDRKPEQPRGIFTEEELRTLFSGPRLWPTTDAWVAFRIASVTGMRSGEVRALTWRQLQSNAILVDRAFKGPVTVGKPKWGIVREIPIPQFLHDDITENAGRAYEWIICSATGQPYSSRTWSEWWRAGLSNAGIPNHDQYGRPRPPHSLRHSLRTHLASHGVADSVAATYLGHELGLSEVDKGYLKLGPADMHAVVTALESIYEWGPSLRLLQRTP